MAYSAGSSGMGGAWDSGAHGTSRWMTPEEANAIALFDQRPDFSSIFLGLSSQNQCAYLNRQGHVLVLAPPRSGKGIGFVVPNLYSYGGSMIVTDPKGENAAQTAEYRSKWQNVIVLDPTEKLASYDLDQTIPTHAFNPLSVFDHANYVEAVEDIERIADALLVPRDGEREPHWRDGACMYVKAILTYLVFFMPVDQRNLIVLSRLASGLELPVDDLYLALTHNDHPDPVMRDVIAKSGAWWSRVNPKERASFVSIALRSLAWLNSPVWHKHLTRSDFHPYDLKAGKTTVYIVCPFDKLEDYSPWFRLVLSSCIVAVLRGPNRSTVPTLFMLDEYAATIGRLAALEQAIPYIEGTGGRFAMIFQSLSQMQKLWPEPEYHGIFASAGAHIFFNTSDEFTSRYVSTYMGKYGAMTLSGGSVGYVQRDLLTPDEVRTLPETDQIVFIRGFRPAWMPKFNVLQNPMVKLLKPNPTYKLASHQRQALKAPAPSTILDAAPAIARAKDQQPSLSLNNVARELAAKFPDKDLRPEGQFLGYDEPWMNPETGKTEIIFRPVVLIDLLNQLAKKQS